LPARWPLRPIGGSTTRRATRPSSKFDRGCQRGGTVCRKGNLARRVAAQGCLLGEQPERLKPELAIRHREWVRVPGEGNPTPLSAWEFYGAARLPPGDSATCGDIGDLTVSDRDYPQALLLSGTQRARRPLRPGLAAPWSSSPPSELRITRVSPCVARGFESRASFMFAGCCWCRSLAVDGCSGASRGHAPVMRRPGSRWSGAVERPSASGVTQPQLVTFTSTEVVYGVTGTEVTELPEYGVSP
jgi:hypothetical protein